ncbi:MAG: hypothetical protein GQ532_07225 [Methylomarinum sp.]|nr:hypothetical protein [Methylomarinum sp.]
MNRRAIVFLAWGEKYIGEIRECIDESILPDVPIFLITDRDTDVSELDGHVQIRRTDFQLTGRRGNGRKAEIWENLPDEFDTFLYLDVDTRVLGDVSLGFDKAEQWGIAISQAAHYSLEDFRDYRDVMVVEGIEPRGQIVYGAGVYFFSRSPQTAAVFSSYRRLVAQYSCTPEPRWGDQPHLTLAMELNDFNPYTLSTGFNHRAFGEWISGQIRIWHSYKPVPENVNELDPVFPRCYANSTRRIISARKLQSAYKGEEDGD